MVFFKIKVNACILIHLICNYKFLGESFKNTLIYLYYIFFLKLQVSNSFDCTPYFFSITQLLFIFFLHLIMFLTPHFFGYYKGLVYDEEIGEI